MTIGRSVTKVLAAVAVLSLCGSGVLAISFAPTVTTATVSGITSTSATSGGNVTDDGGNAVTARGVCWSEATTPTTSDACTSDGTGTGGYASLLTGLTAGTTYHYRAYATNAMGTSYGAELSFTTDLSVPTVTTDSASNETATTVDVAGTVTGDGGSTVTETGFCYSTSANPTTADTCSVVGSGTGTFTYTLTGLTPNATYYVRAYAVNSTGTGYGADVPFDTLTDSPSLTTDSVSNYTATTFDAQATVTADNGAAVTARGFCWSAATMSPTLADDSVAVGSGTGMFTDTITGLAPETTYYLRPYATNSVGTTYGDAAVADTTAAPVGSGSQSSDCTPGAASAANMMLFVLLVLFTRLGAGVVRAKA